MLTELLKKGNGAGGDDGTPAPSSMEATMKSGVDSTTIPASGQVQHTHLHHGQKHRLYIVCRFLRCVHAGASVSRAASSLEYALSPAQAARLPYQQHRQGCGAIVSGVASRSSLLLQIQQAVLERDSLLACRSFCVLYPSPLVFKSYGPQATHQSSLELWVSRTGLVPSASMT